MAKDVPPYVKAVGNPIKLYGLNSVGLERNGFPEEVRRELKRAYRLFFKSELNLSQARERAAAELQPFPEIAGVPRVLRAQRSRDRSSDAPFASASIGAGALGFHHTRILRDVPGATLVGFHDSNAGARGDRSRRSWA